MGHRLVVGLFAIALAIAAFSPSAGRAQHGPHVIVGAGAGGTFYSINARSDEGVAYAALAAYGPVRFLRLETSARLHSCFDCGLDLIAEGGLQLHYPGRSWQPYVGAGGGYCAAGDSDICNAATGYAAVGTWAWFAGAWGARPELRYRRVGSGDMGELSLVLARRLGRTGG